MPPVVQGRLVVIKPNTFILTLVEFLDGDEYLSISCAAPSAVSPALG